MRQPRSAEHLRPIPPVGVSFTTWTPEPPVSAYVQAIRYLVFPERMKAELTVVSDPTPSTELVVSTSKFMTDHRPDGAQVEKPRDFVFGPMGAERAATLRLSGAETRVLSLVLRPGVLFELARVTALELRDAVVVADDLVPRRLTDALRAEISTDSGQPDRQRIQRTLAHHLGPIDLPDLRVRKAVARIAAYRPDVSLRELVASVGLSERQAQRAFAQYVGFTPKQIHRLGRFQAIAARVGRARDEETLAAMAAAHGYADQGHLAREFKEFTGTSPTRYHEKRERALYLGQGPPVGNLQERTGAAP